MSASTPDQLSRLEFLTREYAQYSRTATGLGGAIGGLAGIAIALIAGYTDPPVVVRVALVLTLPGWFLAKGWLRARYYQRLGAASPMMVPASTTLEKLSQGAAGGVAAAMLIACAALIFFNPPKIAALPLLNRLAILVPPASVLLLCGSINTVFEAMTVVNLLVQTVILAAGPSDVAIHRPGMMVWAAMLLLIGGIEHTRFRRIVNELRQFGRH